jgi:hypothetical protein
MMRPPPTAHGGAIMNDFSNAAQSSGLNVKLWRGERMCLIGMDVDQPEADFVGFSVEVKSPGSADFEPLRNRLNFSYDKPADQAVDGYRNYSSLEAPFQKFRWVHFPYEPKGGTYIYRVTKQHMPSDNTLKAGTAVTLDIPLDAVIYDSFLDVGFARNYASSQAYNEKYQGNPNIIPAKPDDGLKFKKVPGDVYQWLGFEAYDLIMNFLTEVANDKTMSLDFFAYDLNEPDIVALLEKTGKRLRAIIDDPSSHKPPTSAESQAAKRLAASAGSNNVKRMHFKNLQHNKVLIAKKNGAAVKVLFGSTNSASGVSTFRRTTPLCFTRRKPPRCSKTRSISRSKTRGALPTIRSPGNGIWCNCRASRRCIFVSRRTRIPGCRSIRSARPSTKRRRRCSFPLRFSIRPRRVRLVRQSIG